MTSTSRLQIVHHDAASWTEIAAGFHDFNYRQCPSFAFEAAKDVSAKMEFVTLDHAGASIAACAVRVKKLPFLRMGVAFIFHGPLTMVDAKLSPGALTDSLGALRRHYVEERKLSLRLVPPDAASLAEPAMAELLGKSGFKRLDRSARRTIMLDTARPLAAIRKSLDGKWRNKLAQVEKLKIDIVETSDPARFAIMAPMLEALEDKKSFRSSRDVAFFTRVQARAAPQERLKLFLAYFQGRPVSAHLCAVAGGIFGSLLAATNDEGRSINASRALSWRMIEDATKLGKSWFDTGGIDPKGNPGVYTFKKGLNGIDFTEPGFFECSGAGVLPRSLGLAETAYRGLRNLRPKFPARLGFEAPIATASERLGAAQDWFVGEKAGLT